MCVSRSVTVVFRGQQVLIALTDTTTCGQVADVVQQHVQQALALDTLRLLVPKQGAVQLLQQPGRLLAHTGVQPGSRCILLGSYQAEIKALHAAQQAEASLRLPGFDYEAQRAAARSTAAGAGGPGRHFFGSFQVLPANPFAPLGAPPPSAALSLLHKLASDPAIADIMQRRGWTVPLLSEMPPEGLVGVSEVCILGWNKNKGQEISLRLRTDDYAGFRKYLAIRKTLVHELTHNVWSDHDINFKKLNSQLLREVDDCEAAHDSARTVTGLQAAYDPTAAQQQQQQQQPVRGRTLAAAAAADGQQLLLDHRALAAPELARAAALARWQEQQQQHASAAPAGAPFSVSEAEGSAAGISGAADAAAAVSDLGLQQYEHEDPATAAAEAAADCLGSLLPDDLQESAAGQLAADWDMQPVVPETGPADKQQQQQQQREGGEVLRTPADPAEACGFADTSTAAAPVTVPAGADAAGCGCCGSDSTHASPQAAAAAAATPPDGAGWTGASTSADHHAGVQGSTETAAAVEVLQPVGPAAAGAADTQSSQPSQQVPWYPWDAAAMEGVDQVLSDKLQRAGQLVQQLLKESSDSGKTQQQQQQQRTALGTLADVLGNLAANPAEPRYRRLRCSNAAFVRKVGRFPAAQQLLLLSGFAEQQQDGGAGGSREQVLVYVRNDPGLVWLILSVVRQALQSL